MSDRGREDLERAAARLADGQSSQDADLGALSAAEQAAFVELERIARAHRESRSNFARDTGVDADTSALESAPAVFVWGMLRAIERVGEGSFGEVWRAYDPSLHREVALKLRRTNGSDTEASVHRSHDPATRHWLAEARALARVRHPNVLTVFGATEHEGRVGMWTELVRGETLEARLARGPALTPHEVASLGADLCAALAAVHDAGLVHGDVKAANVMIEPGQRESEHPRLLLMDFGASGLPSHPGYVAGTPLAMAPELLHGGRPSVASDLYAAGALLHRLLTGRHPIEANTMEELLAAHVRVASNPPRVARTSATRALAPVIERALDPDPARRPDSAETLRRMLLDVLRPGRALVVPLLSLALLATLVSGAWWWTYKRPTDNRYFPPASLPGPVLAGGLFVADTLIGESTDELGWLMVSVGDVNADSCEDVALARVHATRTEYDQGMLELHLGSRTGRFGPAVWHMLGSSRFATFPRALRSTPDVNGDGRPELLVGEYSYRASDHQQVGSAALYLSQGTAFDTLPAWRVIGEEGHASFADYDGLTDAGDVNGDGHPDLLVGAFLNRGGSQGEGEAFLYLGRPGGFSDTPAWRAVGGEPLAMMGFQPGAAGDVNGDGYDDLVLGLRAGTGTVPRAGCVHVYFGSAHGPSRQPDQVLRGQQLGARFGFKVIGVGDLDRDGFDDVMVGEPLWSGSEINTGRALLFRGGRAGLDSIPAWIGTGYGSGAQFGERIMPVGDMNGDHNPEVAITSEAYSTIGSEGSGAVTVVFFDPANLARPSYVHLLPQTGPPQWFGRGLAAAGDFDGDGDADLLIGEPGYDNGPGMVMLVRGRRQPLHR